MEIILLESIGRLGGIGDLARVKAGYARNFLFPRKMALPVNQENLKWVEQQRAELEKLQLQRKSEADQLAAKINEAQLEIEALCGPEGQLHGTVTVSDIVASAAQKDIKLGKNMLRMPEDRIASVGDYEIGVHPAAGIDATLKLKVVAKAQQA